MRSEDVNVTGKVAVEAGSLWDQVTETNWGWDQVTCYPRAHDNCNVRNLLNEVF